MSISPRCERCPVLSHLGFRISDLASLQCAIRPIRAGITRYAAPFNIEFFWDEQREEDGGALVFISQPLEDAIEILGAAVVELVVGADRPVAMVAAGVSDVAPDDKATRVSYGLLNLTHRESRERATALETNSFYRAVVKG